MEQCKRCREYPLFGLDRHTCDPKWTGWEKGEQDSSECEVHASTSESAAIKVAELLGIDYENADFANRGVEICVQKQGSECVDEHTVYSEWDVRYWCND